MAFFTPKLPISGMTGPLGSIDRTIKAGTGLAVKFVRRNGKWSLEQKTAATTTNSPSKQEWADKYFKCDCKWKKLSPTCRLEIQKRQMEIGSKYEKTLPVYHYFMRYCLYGTECDKYLFYNCLETQASYTEYDTYLDVIGWNVNGICNLKSRLILNGQVHEEKISGNNGHVQFILSKDDLLPDTNEIYVQICYKLSDVILWPSWELIPNGDFETGTLPPWTVSQYYSSHEVNETAKYTGSFGFYAYQFPTKSKKAWIHLEQTINVTGKTSLSFWHRAAYQSYGSWGNKLYVYLDGSQIFYLHAKVGPWAFHQADISSYTGLKTLKFRFELWCPSKLRARRGKQYLDDISMY